MHLSVQGQHRLFRELPEAQLICFGRGGASRHCPARQGLKCPSVQLLFIFPFSHLPLHRASDNIGSHLPASIRAVLGGTVGDFSHPSSLQELPIPINITACFCAGRCRSTKEMEAGEKGSAVPCAFGPAHSMLAGIAGWTQPRPQEMSSGLC